MNEHKENLTLTPLEAVMNAHPDIYAEYIPTVQAGSSERGKLKEYPYYLVKGNLSDGRNAAIGIKTMLHEDYDLGKSRNSIPILNVTAVLEPKYRNPSLSGKLLNSIIISFDKDQKLKIQTEVAPDGNAINPEEMRFLALKGLTLLDTYERFASEHEQFDAIRLGKIGPFAGPTVINAPVGSFAYIKEDFEKRLAYGISDLVRQFPKKSGVYPYIEDGKGQPHALRHILSSIEF